MMSKKIVSIEIELENYQPIKFTMAEAKELHEQLDALFAKKETPTYVYPWYSQPYYTWYNATTTSDVRGASTPTTTIWGMGDIANNTVSSDNTNMKVSYLSA